jgi:hypothetical protein
VERKALAFGLLPKVKPASVKQEWNREFGAFLRLPDFRRFSGTVCSKESQKLFWSIQEQLPSKVKNKSHFGEFNAEFIVSYNKQCYKYDFVNSKLSKAIEYNGYNFHPKKSQKNEEVGWCAFHPTKTVKEAKNYELMKYKALKRRGYKILTVWDYEFHQDFEKLVKKCIKFLLN